MTSTVHVDPGICGLKSTIHANSQDGQRVTLTIESECPSIVDLGTALPELDAFEVCFSRFADSPVYKQADENFKHSACPVPAAVVKAVEVAAQLALPKNVSFTIDKT